MCVRQELVERALGRFRAIPKLALGDERKQCVPRFHEDVSFAGGAEGLARRIVFELAVQLDEEVVTDVLFRERREGRRGLLARRDAKHARLRTAFKPVILSGWVCRRQPSTYAMAQSRTRGP